jgi:hypothetical protein
MTTIPQPKNDQSPHAAAIERWDNEGGASSHTSQQKKTKGRKSPISLNRDEQEDT